MSSVDLVPALRRGASRGLSRGRALVATPKRSVQVGRDLQEFRRQERALGRTPLTLEPYVQLRDATAQTPFDPHYAVQGAWVMRQLLLQRPAAHVDVASHVDYLGFFAAACPTTFIDIRPSGLEVPGLVERSGTVLELPFEDASQASVSCLHVIEHVGLGRYGDPVEADGLERACRELARVIAPGGHLYLSTPIGRERLCFNAHRVSDPVALAAKLPDLQVVSFDVVGDDGRYRLTEDPVRWGDQSYALGLYAFTR